MQDQPERREHRVMTPAVVASALFVAACATFAISFVAARGGLHLVPGATPPPVAVATPEPPPSPEQTLAPTAPPVTPAPTLEPTLAPTEPPFALATMKPGDPLLTL